MTEGLPSSFGQALTDIGDVFGIGTQRRQNEFNAEQAQIQRDWEEKMSSTAYQRAVQDMEKAGINPAMAFSNGASASSTPTGASARSSASGSNGSLASVLNAASNFTNSFNNDRNNKNDVRAGQVAAMVKDLAKLIRN